MLPVQAVVSRPAVLARLRAAGVLKPGAPAKPVARGRGHATAGDETRRRAARAVEPSVPFSRKMSASGGAGDGRHPPLEP